MPGLDSLRLLRSAPGRLELRRRYMMRIWPGLAYVARVYRRTFARRVRVVAVIGSVGKTTTMRTASAALARPVRRQAVLNVGSHPGVGRAMFSVRPRDRHAVVEVAIGGKGEMRVLARTVRPDVVIVTAIASDHWQSFGTLEVTRDEKSEILRPLRPTAIVVANADDHHVRWMTTQTRARVVLAGEAADAEIRATDVTLDWPHGMRFNVAIAGQVRPASTKMVGRHMVFGALASIAVGYLEGVPLDEAIARVAAVEPTPGRMQTMTLVNGAYALRDDFKASAESFDVAIQTLAEIPATRRIAVIGEIAEERGSQDYRDVGAKAALADRVVFVGSTKHFQAFRAGLRSAGMGSDRYERVHNAREALDLLRPDVANGDVVFIKGRWQQALGRVGLALAGRDVQCRADPCPFKRMLCDVCPYLESKPPFLGLATRET
ncbi:MAG: UDP-N-acetylmuramoyl-tripeptide--D-alanyl-D-alanine ligase [Chloroflexota bacterium]|nr:UDP-N-acetylmuramoyl-tripeptide--D-alanyl-D-alanine ligase [Chloroflexota bacterium]